MPQGAEWLILLILLLVVGLPALLVAFVVIRTRRMGSSPVAPRLAPDSGAARAPGGPGWFPDPAGRHERRYWDGSSWTEHVQDGQTPATDPLT